MLASGSMWPLRRTQLTATLTKIGLSCCSLNSVLCLGVRGGGQGRSCSPREEGRVCTSTGPTRFRSDMKEGFLEEVGGGRGEC